MPAAPLHRILLAAAVLAAAAAASPGLAQTPDAEAPNGVAQDVQAPPGDTPDGAAAQPAIPVEPPPPVYEDQILRLSEILGALHLLRALCGDGDADVWKREMEAILLAESPGPQRRARLIGRFNHGFETFNATYRSCTPSARRSIRRYLAEGRLLSSDVQARYGQ